MNVHIKDETKTQRKKYKIDRKETPSVTGNRTPGFSVVNPICTHHYTITTVSNLMNAQLSHKESSLLISQISLRWMAKNGISTPNNNAQIVDCYH